MSSQGPIPYYLGVSACQGREHTPPTSHLYALVPKEPEAQSSELNYGRAWKGCSTLYKPYFAAGLRKAQRGLLCLEECYFLWNPACSFSSTYFLGTPIGIS